MRARLWKPGQSGNPSGFAGEYARCQELCRQHSHAAAAEIIRLSTESKDERVRYMAAALVYGRSWGKPKDFDTNTEKTGPRFDPSLLTPEQLD